jgi:hypothetical protein
MRKVKRKRIILLLPFAAVLWFFGWCLYILQDKIGTHQHKYKPVAESQSSLSFEVARTPELEKMIIVEA